MPTVLPNPTFERLCKTGGESITRNAEIIEMRPGDTILRGGAAMRYAIFPHSGQICLSRQGIEILSFGVEGAFIPPAVPTVNFHGADIVVQLGGLASRLDIRHLEAGIANDPATGAVLADNFVSTMEYLCHHVACMVSCPARMRICRWLIKAHQRCNHGPVAIRQSDIAKYLGVRRATVSEVCAELQKLDIIEYRRGRIAILNRPALLAQACTTCPDRMMAA